MITRRLMIAGAALSIAGCAAKIPDYTGPEVTRIQIFKGQRIMQLLHNDQLLKSYKFELGFTPEGHKVFEGDGRTPEGAYWINRRNPNSSYHLSLGISYPNIDDVARARSIGLQPGGDIFIHGTPTDVFGRPDWTAGCIAVSNEEIEEIYAMVNDGTKIFIYP